MVCAYCGYKTDVTNSRLQKRSNQVWRRRHCPRCKATFTTHETIDLASTLLVEKPQGPPEPFITDKLFTEVLLALQDRKDCYMAAREVTNTVIKNLLKLPERPLFDKSQISRTCADVLKRFDAKAFLRYSLEHPSLQP